MTISSSFNSFLDDCNACSSSGSPRNTFFHYSNSSACRSNCVSQSALMRLASSAGKRRRRSCIFLRTRLGRCRGRILTNQQRKCAVGAHKNTKSDDKECTQQQKIRMAFRRVRLPIRTRIIAKGTRRSNGLSRLHARFFHKKNRHRLCGSALLESQKCTQLNPSLIFS